MKKLFTLIFVLVMFQVSICSAEDSTGSIKYFTFELPKSSFVIKIPCSSDIRIRPFLDSKDTSVGIVKTYLLHKGTTDCIFEGNCFVEWPYNEIESLYLDGENPELEHLYKQGVLGYEQPTHLTKYVYAATDRNSKILDYGECQITIIPFYYIKNNALFYQVEGLLHHNNSEGNDVGFLFKFTINSNIKGGQSQFNNEEIAINNAFLRKAVLQMIENMKIVYDSNEDHSI